jgi:hypothetical protein
MTGKEYNILDEIRNDVKTLLQFMATSNERAKHCASEFTQLSKDIAEVDAVAQWSKWKIIFFSGGMALLGVIIGILLKLNK